MSFDISQVVELWRKDQPEYEKLGKLVYNFIKKEISSLEIMPEISYRTKELLSIVKKIKKKQRQKEYDYNSLKDKLGVRVICTFIEDMDKIDTFLKDNFTVKNVEYKKEALDFDKLDYISNHYDLTIKSEINAFKSKKQFKDFVFELQVRTLNQHAWSNTAHTLSYKQEAEIAPGLKRRIYRLLSLYEIADDEFSSVNASLISHPDNRVYTLLRKLEGKIYKYAQVDFDRDTSLYAIKILLSFFSDEEREALMHEIEDFVNLNKDKIETIFTEYRNKYHEIPFLTQPEIFIVWYGLEKFLFSVDDNWDNEFDRTELDRIKALWGATIE